MILHANDLEKHVRLLWCELVLHLWYQLQQSIRQQRADGQGNEIDKHSSEDRPLYAWGKEDTQERGQADHGDCHESKTPDCKQEHTVRDTYRTTTQEGRVAGIKITNT